MSEPHSLRLVSASRAGDAGYLAAADLSAVAAELGVEYRLIGGLGVSLLTGALGVSALVPGRETADADFGAMPEVISDRRLPSALTVRGYVRVEGNRFVRTGRDAGGNLDLTVDLLAPSYTGRLVTNQAHGELSVDEVPGLALALARPPMILQVTVALFDGGRMIDTQLHLADVAAALCMKAYACRDRLMPRDALDIWRLLEAASAAGVRANAWPLTGVRLDAARILHERFARPGSGGCRDATRDRGQQTRIRALLRQVVADPGTVDGPEGSDRARTPQP